ncbi:hypothetical protein PR003_g27010 [Phytophthora rubi]|uniref:HAT C-terminal dimerisation domain-containing protein n=1 Tax=Phytophthora rubi TaxID=129364 RepID=A0A6A4C4L5_9STRA|nr:hypothetical protein PR003_g27010 [Phytophthora rubi]
MRDCLPWLLTLGAGCRELLAFFKRSHKLWFVLRRKLKEKKLRALVLPGDTRWESLLACLDSVLTAGSFLFSMVPARDFQSAKTKSQRQKRKSVFNLVTSRDFVSQLKRDINLLRVIAKHLVKFEKDSTPISEVYNTFLDMPSEFSACNLTPRELKSVEGIITKRFDFVYGDAHGLAYLLDPRFCGDGMDVSTRRSVEKFMSGWFGEDKADDVLIQPAFYHGYVTELKISTSRQWKLLGEGRLPVFDFWCGLKKFDLLQEITKQLFRCAGSTSAAERNFSTHAFIHSKLRNWLTPRSR